MLRVLCSKYMTWIYHCQVKSRCSRAVKIRTDNSPWNNRTPPPVSLFLGAVLQPADLRAPHCLFSAKCPRGGGWQLVLLLFCLLLVASSHAERVCSYWSGACGRRFVPPPSYVQGVSFWQWGSENSWEATLGNWVKLCWETVSDQ